MKKVVVIGGGFGGLSVGLRLLRQGFDVEIVEAGASLGGRARVFESQGQRFDAGPTVITAPYLFDELFELFGERREDWVEFMPVDPFYRIEFNDGSRFDYVGDEERLLAQIRDLCPADVAGYQRLVKHAQAIFDEGYTKLADKSFSHISDMMRIMPSLFRLGAYRSVYSLVSRYIQDERLRQALSFEPLLIGGNPMKVPGIYLLIHWLERKWGVHYARGGTGALVNALAGLFEKHGGSFRLNAPVERILTEGSRACGVELKDGTLCKSDLVVSNADPSMVYEHMLPKKLLRENHPRKIARKRQSMSLFVTYFSTKNRYADLAHHTVVMGPRYQGLLNDIFEKKKLADDFSLYLHAPGRSDPQMVQGEGDCFYVLSPVPNLESSVQWESEKERYQERILTQLENRVMPGLRDNLVDAFSIDPRYFKEELHSAAGAAFGLEPRLTQSAYFRYKNRSPEIANLYFVGAGTHPGAGLPGVVLSAKVAESVIVEDAPQRARPQLSGGMRYVHS